MKVADVMTNEVVTVPPGASLKEAARLLIEHRISGLPVVDNQNHVLGVVSEADVLPEGSGRGAASPTTRLADQASSRSTVPSSRLTLSARR